MDSMGRKVETSVSSTGKRNTHKTSSRLGRSLSTQKNKHINISITEIAAELEAPPTSLPTRAAEATEATATLTPPPPPPPMLQSADTASSIYSRTPSSRCRDYKNFLAGKWSSKSSAPSSLSSSRATSTSTASKKSTREFLSCMSAYPWITGNTSSGLTSSAASAVGFEKSGRGSRSSSNSSSSSSKKKMNKGDGTPLALPILSGCV